MTPQPPAPHAVPRTVTVLGSTGSIGTQTLEVIGEAPSGRYQVEALVAGRNAGLLAEQARRFGARLAVIADPACGRALADALAGSGIEVAAGPQAVVEAASRPAEWTMAAITGAAGLHATLAAIARGRTVALANKEALVCAGPVMLAAVRSHGATLLPVDSEHNAIFQAMADGNQGGVERITLTASGGPFRTATLEEMRRAGPDAALRHPIWSMGAKISIDSATLMNKGLELIEAAHLFGLPSERIGILVHPQSVVHGMVHYADGSVLAQLGSPDMRVPIAHTLAFPSRMAISAPRLDLAAIGRLEFFEPDAGRFPALRLAREVLAAGGAAASVLNAANEVAVDAYLRRRIGFLHIVEVAEEVLSGLRQPAGRRPGAGAGGRYRGAPGGAALLRRAGPLGSLTTRISVVFHLLPAPLNTIVPFMIVLGVLVFVHELGHYLVARWCGVHVEAFSIGFGRPIARWRDRAGTEWRLSVLPLGGYVKLHGLERPEEAGADVRALWQPGRTFHEKTVLSRALVIAAGPAANFVLAAVVVHGVVRHRRAADRDRAGDRRGAAEQCRRPRRTAPRGSHRQH